MRSGVRAVWQATASPASESLRGLGRADTLTASSSGSCETCIKAHVDTHGAAFPWHGVAMITPVRKIGTDRAAAI
ncbi:hypothetical protein PD5205_02121 [Xanthomonas fragariae]|uniref:Uncharacterized protein n=2 Tax=Xanthomonas fragariae TaxID=48664 RepID=A0A1Y6HDC8_9XANT|nr:hypothetical protein NBC2815_01871 [Xanthomonas fragariae]SMQ99393.1 hypothetical protein PD885_02150 [Xanthomonas fragariae]SMR03423.1 hypothetical protein PD5205_02121 [Xanthomonas fragariae]